MRPSTACCMPERAEARRCCRSSPATSAGGSRRGLYGKVAIELPNYFHSDQKYENLETEKSANSVNIGPDGATRAEREPTTMLPAFILPETTIREAGVGPALEIGDSQGGLVLLTLGITRIIEQESLDVSIWGSEDDAEWGAKPLIAFPQKFYCGTYQVLLDLSQHPKVKYLRAKWQVARWGRGGSKPLFGAYVFAQDFEEKALAMGA
jgi:hypothetical protein